MMKLHVTVVKKTIHHCGNTTNMIKHIKLKHPKEHDEVQLRRAEEVTETRPPSSGLRQSSLAESFQRGRHYPDNSQRASAITRSIGEMIVRDLQPISVVEDRGFIALVKTLDQHYQIPNRKKLMEGTINNMYEDCKAKVMATLQNENHVILTTDMWTSRSTEVYLTVSCHFINNWQMQEFMLETCHFSAQHTDDNISAELKRIAEEWGITEKVLAVVTDNGANMVSAVHKAGWKHYPCFAHTLNLVVKDAIKASPEIFHLLEKCRSIVSFFHHSTKATEKLKQIQKQLKVTEHKLIISVETRWSSAFYMLERLHEQMDSVTTALCLLEKSDLCFTNEERSATREVSAEKHISISKVIPPISLLLRATAASERQGCSFATELAQQCQRRFRGVETIHSLAASTFLDMRFKHLAFRDKDHVEAVKKQLLSEMQDVHLATSELAAAPEATSTSVLRSVSVPTASCASSVTPMTPRTASATSKGGIWEDFDIQVLSAQQQQSQIVPRNQDPLVWWRNHEQTFPALSKLAKKYLGITASSVPSERIFSKAGELISQRRNRLKGKNVNILFVSSLTDISGFIFSAFQSIDCYQGFIFLFIIC
uniref:HAT C-terminal dimerisation domain-containing protein n=1 Tax=Sinocyclocheilus grahami TaxID=75366 RepID=A0A672ST01_SINGR